MFGYRRVGLASGRRWLEPHRTDFQTQVVDLIKRSFTLSPTLAIFNVHCYWQYPDECR
jgi:hypothetical protein